MLHGGVESFVASGRLRQTRLLLLLADLLLVRCRLSRRSEGLREELVGIVRR